MKNYLLLGFVFLLFASFGFADDGRFEVLYSMIAVANNVDIDGTLCDEFNDCSFRVNEKIPAIFSIENIKVAGGMDYNISFVSEDTNEHIDCIITETVPFGETVYRSCTVTFDDDGIYYATLEIDGMTDEFRFQIMDIKHALPSALFWVLIGILILTLMAGFFITGYAFILSLMIIVVSYLELVNTYAYIIGGNLFTGLILSSFVMLVFMVVFVMDKTFKEV